VKISAVNKSSGREFYVFYQKDSSSPPLIGWNWKLAIDMDEVCTFLNAKGPKNQGITDARVCGFSKGRQTEFYVFYRLGEAVAQQTWDWKLVTSVKEAAAFLNGSGAYTIPVKHAEIVTATDGKSTKYYIFYQPGSPGQPPVTWTWSEGSGPLEGVAGKLNPEGDYPSPIHDAKIVTSYLSGIKTIFLIFYPPGFLIVTRPLFVSSLLEYINWKHAKGFEVYVVTAEWIDAHVPGDDLVLKIRNCIRHYVKSVGLRFDLLIGDSVNFDFNHVPPQPVLSEPWNLPVGCYRRASDGGYEPTSAFFSDPSDNVEIDPLPRKYPVATGVIPVRIPAELDNVLYKTMNATRTRQISIIISEDVDSVYKENWYYALQALGGPGITFSRSVFGTSATESQVLAAIFEQPGVVVEYGHGSHYDFVIGPIAVDSTDAHLFQYINPLFIMISCRIFAYPSVNECLIEAFLKSERGPAIITNEILSSGPATDMSVSEVGFWQDLFAGKSIGQAIYDNCNDILARFYLFGDPSLVIFDKK
jgi:hypothetical protein